MTEAEQFGPLLAAARQHPHGTHDIVVFSIRNPLIPEQVRLAVLARLGASGSDELLAQVAGRRAARVGQRHVGARRVAPGGAPLRLAMADDEQPVSHTPLPRHPTPPG